jgi:hypothetical protein
MKFYPKGVSHIGYRLNDQDSSLKSILHFREAAESAKEK